MSTPEPLIAAARPRNLELSVQRAIYTTLAAINPSPVWLAANMANISWDEENFKVQEKPVGTETIWKYDRWVKLEWLEVQNTTRGRNILQILIEGRTDIDKRLLGVRLVRDDIIDVMNQIAATGQPIYDYGIQLQPVADDSIQNTNSIFWVQPLMNTRRRDEATKKENEYGISGWKLLYEIVNDTGTRFYR